MNVILQYESSSGNVYNLKTDGIRTKTANYHKWNWTVSGTTLQFGTRVSAFKRSAATYTTKLIFTGTYQKRKEMLDALHQDFELDVRNKTPGKIIWGDYYIRCYITDSSTEPDDKNFLTDNTLTIYAPYPFWIKESTKEFFPQEAPEDEQYLEYEFDYSYDYFYGTPGISTWNRDFPFSSEFRMTVYGPAIDPRVLINGYPYQFFETLEAGEYVVIDSRENKITKYMANGQTMNLFDKRNKEDSIFEQIPGGNLIFNWTGAFGFGLTLYDERSEPRWTM